MIKQWVVFVLAIVLNCGIHAQNTSGAANPHIIVEKDEDGKFILAPHTYTFKDTENFYQLNFSYGPGKVFMGEGKLNADGSNPIAVTGKDATYSLDGNKIMILTGNFKILAGIISADGKTIILEQGNNVQEYKISK